MRKIKKVKIHYIFEVTYTDGETITVKDTELSDKKLSVNQYLYALEYNPPKYLITADHQRALME